MQSRSRLCTWHWPRAAPVLLTPRLAGAISGRRGKWPQMRTGPTARVLQTVAGRLPLLTRMNQPTSTDQTQEDKERGIFLNLAMIAVLVGVLGIFSSIGVSFKNLSLVQWSMFVGGILVGIVAIPLASLRLFRHLSKNYKAKFMHWMICMFAILATLGVYGVGANCTYNFALNSGKTQPEAAISGLYSFVSVCDDFITFMYDNRNEPLSGTWQAFKLLISPKETSPPGPLTPP